MEPDAIVKALRILELSRDYPVFMPIHNWYMELLKDEAKECAEKLEKRLEEEAKKEAEAKAKAVAEAKAKAEAQAKPKTNEAKPAEFERRV